MNNTDYHSKDIIRQVSNHCQQKFLQYVAAMSWLAAGCKQGCSQLSKLHIIIQLVHIAIARHSLLSFDLARSVCRNTHQNENRGPSKASEGLQHKRSGFRVPLLLMSSVTDRTVPPKGQVEIQPASAR